MARVPRTAIYLDMGVRIEAGRTGPARLIDGSQFDKPSTLERALDQTFYEPDTRLSQTPMPSSILQEHYQLERRLGEGSYGTAFLCSVRHQGRGIVIKLPNELLRDDVRTEENLFPLTIQNALLPRAETPEYRESMRLSVYEMRHECHIAELVLEPPYLRAIRLRMFCEETVRDRQREARPDQLSLAATTMLDGLLSNAKQYQGTMVHIVGSRLKQMTPARYHRACMTLCLHRTHPGFYHIHSVLHMDPTIPALISQRANGSLGDLLARAFRGDQEPDLQALFTFRRQRNGTHWMPPPMWLMIATQLSSAMQFLHECTPISHLDLKPGNILYICPTGQETRAGIRCLISDFGMCARHSERIPRKESYPEAMLVRLMGSVPFVPPTEKAYPLWFTGGATAKHLSCYQFMATLVDLLLIPHATEQDPSRFAQIEQLRKEPNGFVTNSLHAHIANLYHGYFPGIYHDLNRRWVSEHDPSAAPFYHLFRGVYEHVGDPELMLRDFAAFTGSIRKAFVAETAQKDYGEDIRRGLDASVTKFREEQSAIAEISAHMLANALFSEEKEAIVHGRAPSQPSSNCADRELQLANYVQSDVVVYNWKDVPNPQPVARPPIAYPQASRDPPPPPPASPYVMALSEGHLQVLAATEKANVVLERRRVKLNARLRDFKRQVEEAQRRAAAEGEAAQQRAAAQQQRRAAAPPPPPTNTTTREDDDRRRMPPPSTLRPQQPLLNPDEEFWHDMPTVFRPSHHHQPPPAAALLGQQQQQEQGEGGGGQSSRSSSSSGHPRPLPPNIIIPQARAGMHGLVVRPVIRAPSGPPPQRGRGASRRPNHQPPQQQQRAPARPPPPPPDNAPFGAAAPPPNDNNNNGVIDDGNGGDDILNDNALLENADLSGLDDLDFFGEPVPSPDKQKASAFLSSSTPGSLRTFGRHFLDDNDDLEFPPPYDGGPSIRLSSASSGGAAAAGGAATTNNDVADAFIIAFHERVFGPLRRNGGAAPPRASQQKEPDLGLSPSMLRSLDAIIGSGAAPI